MAKITIMEWATQVNEGLESSANLMEGLILENKQTAKRLKALEEHKPERTLSLGNVSVRQIGNLVSKNAVLQKKVAELENQLLELKTKKI